VFCDARKFLPKLFDKGMSETPCLCSGQELVGIFLVVTGHQRLTFDVSREEGPIIELHKSWHLCSFRLKGWFPCRCRFIVFTRTDKRSRTSERHRTPERYRTPKRHPTPERNRTPKRCR